MVAAMARLAGGLAVWPPILRFRTPLESASPSTRPPISDYEIGSTVGAGVNFGNVRNRSISSRSGPG
jgi:hypothetical protein